MATQAIRLRAEILRALAFSALSIAYAKLGAPFANPVRIFHLQNLTDQNILYSFDGITVHGVVAAGGFILLDVTTNKSLDQGQFIAQGTQIYVATILGDTAPTKGSVYLSVFYGATN
jgi:hypothetical protein